TRLSRDWSSDVCSSDLRVHHRRASECLPGRVLKVMQHTATNKGVLLVKKRTMMMVATVAAASLVLAGCSGGSGGTGGEGEPITKIGRASGRERGGRSCG